MFKPVLMISALFAAAALVWGQGAMVRPPEMPGVFSPVIGSGATYRVTTAQNRDVQFTYAIVGKESDGYWMEIRTSTPKGQLIMKQLMGMPGEGKAAQVKRMIMQAAGQPPMELPVSMINGAAGRAQAQGAATPHGLGEKAGAETVTVAAGTFECEHYVSESNGKHSDVWVSSKVSPYGLVKMISGEMQMELQRVLVNETSQITGEPMKLPSYPGAK